MKLERTREQYQTEAGRRMVGFTYTRVASAGDAEIWRCQKPGTGIYQFDITVTRYGIAMFGDVDGLIWRVGSSYGLPFLAGDSMSYIHEKLEPQCQEKEVHQDSLKAQLVEWICAKFVREKVDGVPEWFKDDDLRADRYPALLEWLKENDHFSERWCLESLSGLTNLHEVYTLLQENGEALGDPDMCEISIAKPTEELIQRLYMVNHAAKAIVKIKCDESVCRASST